MAHVYGQEDNRSTVGSIRSDEVVEIEAGMTRADAQQAIDVDDSLRKPRRGDERMHSAKERLLVFVYRKHRVIGSRHAISSRT